MEKIIERAIQGGYEKERYYFDENGNWDWEPAEVMLMKPVFWQSLGLKNPSVDYLEFMHKNYFYGWNKAVELLENLVCKI